MLKNLYGRQFLPGRDSFLTLLRHHKLMLPPIKTRHTTNSNHRFHKWKNLIKGITLYASNMLWVSDITYISLSNGDTCYLHLITDAYSHKIVGWQLAHTLCATETIAALNQAINQAVQLKGDCDLSSLIHHSDRGIQYCCNEYVKVLKKYHIKISMTEDYKPTDNAIAERVNGIIKTETQYRKYLFRDFEHAYEVISRYITFYNNKRPHMSIGYKTPSIVHQENGEQQKKWKNKIYTAKEKDKAVSLPE